MGDRHPRLRRTAEDIERWFDDGRVVQRSGGDKRSRAPFGFHHDQRPAVGAEFSLDRPACHAARLGVGLQLAGERDAAALKGNKSREC
jgi:hypothetical protein